MDSMAGHSQEAFPLVVAIAARLLRCASSFKAATDGIVLGDRIEGKISASLVGGGEPAIGR